MAEEKRQREKNWKDTQESFNQAEITVYKNMVEGAVPREIKWYIVIIKLYSLKFNS